MIGEGKYDRFCTWVRKRTKAKAAFVIIVDGNQGSGFSGQCENPALLKTLPAILELMAAEIRAKGPLA